VIDLSIIRDCANNSAAAQRELYNRYSGLMFGICVRYSSCKDEAEDMLQESFIRIFKGIETFEFKGNFEGWMKRIVVNTCINFIKKNKKFTDHINLDTITHLEYKEESVASKLLGKQVMECLLMMPLSFRTVINLYAIEGYSHKEIAEMLDIEETNCRSQYIRGKHILERILMQKKLIPEKQERLEWLALLNR
jgi:RNA polymerase sigma-70 factor (ECF subfamily)